MATQLTNLQKSEIVIASILQVLIETGIQWSGLKFDDLALDEEFRPFFDDCGQWLIDEGVIRCAEYVKPLDRGHSLLIRPVITSKGFALLGQSFTGTDGNMKLSAAVTQVAKDQRNLSQIGDFFGGLLGGFTKSIGS
ncbi:hypothetical protein [Rubellimicrobium mesophilum]|uniref:hypothetical protein n=1 Tax=Rubellimicrobium mesophilum TaxID=1123067 RepID=UPI0012E0DB3E|nr:hypothetical protein [Rubellimicrobium mesophilum]